MAVTQTQLDALVDAYATGALRVSYDGKTIEYRSRADLEAQIGKVSAALGVSNPLAPVVSKNRIGLVSYTRG